MSELALKSTRKRIAGNDSAVEPNKKSRTADGNSSAQNGSELAHFNKTCDHANANSKDNSSLETPPKAACSEQAAEYETPISRRNPEVDESSLLDPSTLMELPRLSALLSVPLKYVFRQVPPLSSSLNQSRHKPLLSRNEAHCFLTIATLATEFDSLVSTSSRVLEEKMEIQSFLNKIYNNHHKRSLGYMGSLYALGTVMGDELLVTTLHRIDELTNQILEKLERLLVQLQQSSEQNWTTYESLQDDSQETAVNLVALEKRRLSEIQDEMVRRIESLFAMKKDDDDDSCNMNDDEMTELQCRGVGLLDSCSMAKFCGQTFGELSTSTMENDTTPLKPTRMSSSQTSRVSTGSSKASKVSAMQMENKTPEEDRHQKQQKQNSNGSPHNSTSDNEVGNSLLTSSQTISPVEDRTNATQVAADALGALAAAASAST